MNPLAVLEPRVVWPVLQGKVQAQAITEWVDRAGEAAAVVALKEASLVGVWFDQVASADCFSQLPSGFVKRLRVARVGQEVIYQKRRRLMADIGRILDQAELPYLFFKGVSLAECLYPSPATRATSDIDLLVDPGRRLEAISLLSRNGFEHRLIPEVVSHETMLYSDGVEIDLHWDLARPGRFPSGVAAAVLQRRESHEGLWFPGSVDNLLLAAVQPLLTSRGFLSEGRLIRLFDMYLWLKQADVALEPIRLRAQEWGVANALCTALGVVSRAFDIKSVGGGECRQLWSRRRFHEWADANADLDWGNPRAYLSQREVAMLLHDTVWGGLSVMYGYGRSLVLRPLHLRQIVKAAGPNAAA